MDADGLALLAQALRQRGPRVCGHTRTRAHARPPPLTQRRTAGRRVRSAQLQGLRRLARSEHHSCVLCCASAAWLRLCVCAPVQRGADARARCRVRAIVPRARERSCAPASVCALRAACCVLRVPMCVPSGAAPACRREREAAPCPCVPTCCVLRASSMCLPSGRCSGMPGMPSRERSSPPPPQACPRVPTSRVRAAYCVLRAACVPSGRCSGMSSRERSRPSNTRNPNPPPSPPPLAL